MVREIGDIAGFDALEDVWQSLFVMGSRSVLQSFAWSRTWWKHFGEGDTAKQLKILLVESETDVIGIAPLFVEEIRLAGIPIVRRAAFIGRETSDYLDVLARPGREGQVAGEIAEYLAGMTPTVDVIQLEDMPDSSSVRSPLDRAIEGLMRDGRMFVNEQCPRTFLRGTWEETLAGFAINHRREINRRRRNMSKSYAVEFEMTADAAAVRHDMEEFIAMHQRRWNVSGHLGVFADEQSAEFHKDIACQFFQKGWLALSFLRLNGARVAANYGFRYGDAIAIYLTGVGEAGDAWKLSPGRVLMGYCMEEAIRSGAAVFDFMRGTEQYKYEFDAKDVPNWTILRFRSRNAALRFKAHALALSFQRRSRAEWYMFQRVAADEGVFSPAMVRHVRERLGVVLHDGMAKLRAPERAVERKEQ